MCIRDRGYTGWKLVAVVPSTTLWDNYGQLILFFLFVVLFSVYLLIFVNLRLSGWITAPVKKLDRAVKALEAGEQVADFDVGGPYEVEHLSHSIESMVSTLRHLMDDIIEQEKQKRRSELDEMCIIDRDMPGRQRASGCSIWTRLWCGRMCWPSAKGWSGPALWNFWPGGLRRMPGSVPVTKREIFTKIQAIFRKNCVGFRKNEVFS